VPELVENFVPSLPPASGGLVVTGDGNGDGMADRLQTDVVSVPFRNTPQVSQHPYAHVVFVTLVAGSTQGKVDTTGSTSAALASVVQQDAPANLPAALDMPLGVIGFTANVGTARTEETFSLYVGAGTSVNGYWVLGNAGVWVNLASAAYGGAMVQEGDKLRLDFKLVDGGEFDTNNMADGVITAQGGLAHMPLSLVGYTPDMPVSGFWF